MTRLVSASAVVTLLGSIVLAGCAAGGPESGEVYEGAASEENIAETTPAVRAGGECCYAACVDGTRQWYYLGAQQPGHCIDAAKTYCAKKGHPFEDAAWGTCH